MNRTKKKLILLNSRQFAKSNQQHDCGDWLKRNFAISSNIANESNAQMYLSGDSSAYYLAVEYIIGQLDLLEDHAIRYFLMKRIDHANVCYDHNNFKQAYLWIHSTSKIIKRIIKMPDVMAETFLTRQMLKKRMPGHLYQMDTCDGWNICGMYIAVDPITKTFNGPDVKKEAIDTGWLLNYPGFHDLQKVNNQRYNRFFNHLMNNFLYDEHLLKEYDLAPGMGRFAMISQSAEEVKSFIEARIADKGYADFIASVILNALKKIDVPIAYRWLRGELFTMEIFSPQNMKHCFDNSKDKDDDMTTRVVGYFHSVILMLDMLIHHFWLPEGCSKNPPVSATYYHFMNYLHNNRFGPYKND